PDGAPLYPGTALAEAEIDRRRAEDMPYAVRLDMARAVDLCGPLAWLETGSGPEREGGEVQARPQAWGDVVLARKDCPTSYHLAVVIDDAVQGVSHVVRGQDLFWSTSVHRVLQRLLGLPAPVYHHHRLIRDANGRKLSKSAGDTGLGALRAAGATPADVRRLVGFDQ
ncbi:MAG: tRNA glutamyl-Q(34) synthetase GluQRS, partial [Hyphomicrobiales bacterium]|nr:tRNA glutamyl-Q(34) synthetase GluQRS [Hyphomicrobiales bacterium]